MPPRKANQGAKSSKVAPDVNNESSQPATASDHLVLEVLPGTRKDLDGQLLAVSRKLASSGAQVGRTKASPVWIKEASVSERHARFTWSGEEKSWMLQDLGSSNGTEINGEPIEEEARNPLKHGDTIKFGSVEVRVHTHRPIPADITIRRLLEEEIELEIQHTREQARQLQSKMQEDLKRQGVPKQT